ncbi:MAG TPA: Obg family GTPase CgtA, partial [Atribacterota bacterium]|nr:Obg family GTPase CgtA [Atribacterota bacterium]
QFVLADIPGLIEGASQGAGLGTRFLKHIERTKVIIHLIDGARVEGKNILKDYYAIKSELAQFSSSLKNKEELIAINKFDLLEVQQHMAEIRESFAKEGKSIFFISALTGEGVRDLIYQIFRTLKLAEKKEEYLAVPAHNKLTHYAYRQAFTIKKEGGQFVIDGKEINKLAYQYDLDNPQALRYFQEKLKRWGVEKALKKMGAQEGDMVRIGEKEFYFFP